jgi:hypothetical protein
MDDTLEVRCMHMMPWENLCNPYNDLSGQKLKKERAIATVSKNIYRTTK